MITLVVPIYNEVDAIPDLVAQIDTFIKKNNYIREVFFVNDGSTDDSLKTLKIEVKKTRNFKKYIILDNPRNMGYGASLKRGIKESRNEWVGIIDADLTYDIEDIHKMYLYGNEKRATMVVAARSGKEFEGNFVKKRLRSILRIIVQYMTDQDIPDINSGLRIFRTKFAKTYLPLLSNRFSFTTSITLVSMLSGGSVGYIKSSYEKRSGSTKVRLWKDAIRTLAQIISVSFFFNPLKIVYPLFGFIILIQTLIVARLEGFENRFQAVLIILILNFLTLITALKIQMQSLQKQLDLSSRYEA